MSSIKVVVTKPRKSQIRDNLLSSVVWHLRSIGVAEPSVGPDTEYWRLAELMADELIVSARRQFPN